MTSRRLLGAALTLALVAPLAWSGPAVAADSWSVPSSATVTVSVKGYGHGHGLSQYGAEGAARKGLTYQQIVAFYYPGTTWGTDAGAVKVLVTADTSPDVLVVQRTGLKATNLKLKRTWAVAESHPKATRWRIKPLAAGRTRIDYRNASGWHPFRTFRGDAEFSANAQPIALVLPGGTTVRYRGRLRSTAGDTVNVLPFDSYLKGVVPTEVFPSWHPAALRAQAVAARTYAAYEKAHRTGSHYDLCDTTSCQVYGGYSAETPTTNAAVDATKGRIRVKGGQPIFAQFSASNGGWTSAGGFSYLPAKKDPYDGWSGNPYTLTTATFTDKALEKVFPSIGNLTSIKVTGRDGHGAFGGRADDVTLTGAKGSVTRSGEDLRSLLALRSDWFTFAAKTR